MEPHFYDDERDHEIGGVNYNGLIPGHGRFDFEHGRVIEADGNVLNPKTVKVCPVTFGYELRQLARTHATSADSYGIAKVFEFHEGVAQMSATSVMGNWTPRDQEPTAVTHFSNALIDVDALSMGLLLSRCGKGRSISWMNGFHGIHFDSGVVVLDSESRLRCWLPYA